MTTAADVFAIITGAFPDMWASLGVSNLGAMNAALADVGLVEATQDITAEADTYRYAVTIPPDQVYRVDVIASGATKPEEFFWWKAHTGYLHIDAKLPGAGDTLRVYYYDKPTALTATSDVIPPNIDPARLAWVTVYYLCLNQAMKAENTDPTLKVLLERAEAMRNEFLVRRPTGRRAPSPHFSNW